MVNQRLRSCLVCIFLAAALLAACADRPASGSLTTWPIETATSQPADPPAAQAPSAAPLETVALAPTNTIAPLPTATTTSPPAPAPIQPVTRLAVIGDYGSGDANEAAVSDLVKGWQPDFILTLGDNNYPSGAADTIDQNIGQFYAEYIAPYNGAYGSGAELPRFFPTLGNHDWDTGKAGPYLEYFSLPGNERYYDFTWGALHIFALDSDSREPDGVSRSSPQAQWLQEKLAGSSKPWKLVIMHHPPYSSGTHGSVDWMRWPFAEWGASAVLAGHDHTYERLLIDGLLYLNNGLGGGAIYDFDNILDGSQVRYNEGYGALLITAEDALLRFEFISTDGTLIDRYEMYR